VRKLLNTRRVNSIAQIGTDRIIEFQFSDGLYRLFLEFYAGGNIVVTDKELTIMALLRNVSEGEEHQQLKLGVKYDLSMRQNYNGIPDLTVERIKGALESVVAKEKPTAPESEKAPKKKGGVSLRKAIAVSIKEFPPVLVDHALRVHGFNSSIPIADVIGSVQLLDDLLAALKEAQNVISAITSSEKIIGYIIAKKRKAISAAVADAENETTSEFIYEDFQPFKPKQFEGNEDLIYLEYDGFNKTVDEFYSSIEGQKLSSRLAEREVAAMKKLQDARNQHQKRLGTLQEAQELNIRKAEAILANISRVEEAVAAVNGLVAQGMDWVDIARLIEAEQGRGNAVAQMVKLPLKLYENTVTLLLGEPEADDDDSEDQGSDSEEEHSDSEGEENVEVKNKKPVQDRRLAIDIQLDLSPWANASQYYDQKKTAAVKEEKTLEASRVALKSVEVKVMKDLKKGLNKEKDILRPLRRHFWFEKFYHFTSSDGYLVLADKDIQQSELLYSKYFDQGDVYIHADIENASSVVIKNNPATPNAPIPPSTLSQAGTFSVASSSAWDWNASMSAWWVGFGQVSKLSPTGEYLQPGVFHISGEKNFLPAAQLVVGIGLLFHISEDSKVRHIKRRLQEDTTAAADTTAEDAAKLTLEIEDEHSDEDFPDIKHEAAALSSDEEDFPDAKPEAEDSDEDFPDVNPGLDSDSEEEENSILEQNPLQPTAQPPEGYKEIVKLPIREQGEAHDDNVSIANTITTVGGSSSGTRHLSAKERRLLRKGVNPDLIDRSQTSSPAPVRPGADEQDNDDLSDATTTATTQQSRPLPRGKRTKQKKAAAKYANQDEEDRKAAMARLGSKADSHRKATEAAARKAKEEKEMADKQRRREQHLHKQAIGKAAEEARRAGMNQTKADSTAAAADDDEDAGTDADDATKKRDLLDLHSLVGRPLPGDEILAAIPICAPWTALATMKYKVKLQPGTAKKGKACREVLGKWQADAKDARNVDVKSEDRERVWPREAELIAGLRDTEIIAVVPVGRLKVVIAGGKAAQKGKGKASNRGGRGSKR
jgi:predicted ribosome quality control (RQC) complex YloA/Tae2 family protein